MSPAISLSVPVCLSASCQFYVCFVLECLFVFDAVCIGTAGGQLSGLPACRRTLHVPVA
jgi:hypothetical protein